MYNELYGYRTGQNEQRFLLTTRECARTHRKSPWGQKYGVWGVGGSGALGGAASLYRPYRKPTGSTVCAGPRTSALYAM
jgi:hypothetical protein